MSMNTDYAQIMTWKTALFGRSQCSWNYIWYILCYNDHEHWLRPDNDLRNGLRSAQAKYARIAGPFMLV